MAEPRIGPTLLAAMLLVGCADLDLEGGLCTEERDPDEFYCRAGTERQGSLDALGAAMRTSAGGNADVLWVRNSLTDTLNPNGRDVAFRLWTYDSSEPMVFFIETEAAGFVSTGRAVRRLAFCDGAESMTVLDTAVVVPDAVARYEEMFGPLVLDSTTRTAFRQSAACFSSAGEVEAHFAIQHWNETDGFQTWFFRYDGAGAFLDVLGPCADFESPEACTP